MLQQALNKQFHFELSLAIISNHINQKLKYIKILTINNNLGILGFVKIKTLKL